MLSMEWMQNLVMNQIKHFYISVSRSWKQGIFDIFTMRNLNNENVLNFCLEQKTLELDIKIDAWSSFYSSAD